MVKRRELEDVKGSKDSKDADGVEDLHKLLGDQLTEVQSLLTLQYEKAAALASRHVEARHRAEARNDELKEEIRHLRKLLIEKGVVDSSDQEIQEITDLSSFVSAPLSGATSQTSDRGARLDPLPGISPSASSQSRGSNSSDYWCNDGSCDSGKPPLPKPPSSFANSWIHSGSCETIDESYEPAKPPMPREFAPQPKYDPPELKAKDARLPGVVAFGAGETDAFKVERASFDSGGFAEVVKEKENKVLFRDDAIKDKDADGNKQQEEGPSTGAKKRFSQLKSMTSPSLGQAVPLAIAPLEPLAASADASKQGLVRAQSNFLRFFGSAETKPAEDEADEQGQERKPVPRKSFSQHLHTAAANLGGMGRVSARQSVVNNRQAAVFADAAAMKEKVRQAIGKDEYSVFDFYKDDGIAQLIARSAIFENFTLLVIAVNSLWIAFDADANPSPVLNEAPLAFQIAEHSFAMYFFVEWSVRFMSFEEKRMCLKDSWFVFDSCLVAMMILETWLLSILIAATNTNSTGGGLGNTSMLRLLRLLRLTRMARMARLLRAMPELMIMIKGMTVAMRSVLFTLVLLLIIIYLFALVFRQLTDGLPIGEKYFKSTIDSMITLLLRGTLPDLADLIYDVADYEIMYAMLLLVFILFATLTVMNMLVGVLCEVVSVVSAVEKEQLIVTFVKTKLQSVFDECTGEFEHRLGKSEFQDFLGNAQAAKALHEVGVDVVGLMEITDFLFKDGRTVDFPNFMEMLLELRGTNTATVKHIVDLQRFVHLELRRNKKEMVEHVAALSDLMAEARATTGKPSSKNAITKIARLCSQSYGDDEDLEGMLERGSILGSSVTFDRGGTRQSITHDGPRQSISHDRRLSQQSIMSKGQMSASRESRRRHLSRTHR